MAEFILPQELQKLLKDKRNICLLDVRRKQDYEADPQKIETAKWVDPDKKEDWAGSIPKDRDIIVYCVKGGSVSRSVADYLLTKQCDARFLQGGIKAWTEMKMAVTDEKKPAS